MSGLIDEQGSKWLEDAGIRTRTYTQEDIDDLKLPALDWENKVYALKPKASIGQWRIVEIGYGDKVGAVLVGYKDGYECRVTCTSFIVAIANDGRALITENGSLYQLHHPASGEPDGYQIMGMAYTLRGWGLGTNLKSKRVIN